MVRGKQIKNPWSVGPAIMAILIIFVLSLWCVLSLWNQLTFAFGEGLRRFDAFQLLPRWAFFAPNPGITDYHLVYLLKSHTRDFDAWQEVSWSSGRAWSSCVWNPTKRYYKIQFDAINAIMSICRDNSTYEEGALVLTIPYLLLLNIACSHSCTQQADSIQFAIVQTHGFEPRKEPTVVLRSRLHSFSST
jgi:hypothetical protein